MTPPATPSHGTKLGLLGVSLTMNRLPKNAGLALKTVSRELEPVLARTHFFENKPFSWITLAIRFGTRDDIAPRYNRINKKYGDLPISIEIDTQRIAGKGLQELVCVFRDTAALALIHVGQKYGCATTALIELQCRPDSKPESY